MLCNVVQDAYLWNAQLCCLLVGRPKLLEELKQSTEAVTKKLSVEQGW